MTMGRFLTRLATACALLGAAPAYAQHSGHSMPMTAMEPHRRRYRQRPRQPIRMRGIRRCR